MVGFHPALTVEIGRRGRKEFAIYVRIPPWPDASATRVLIGSLETIRWFTTKLELKMHWKSESCLFFLHSFSFKNLRPFSPPLFSGPVAILGTWKAFQKGAQLLLNCHALLPRGAYNLVSWVLEQKLMKKSLIWLASFHFSIVLFEM